MKNNKTRPIKILLPITGETVAIATRVKTAALCYDRILWPDIPPPYNSDIPDSIRCCGESRLEMHEIKMMEAVVNNHSLNTVGEEKLKDDIISTLVFANVLSPNKRIYTKKDIEYLINELEQNPFPCILNYMRMAAKSFSKKYAINISVVCSSEKERSNLYKEGNREVIVSTLSELEIVDELELTWDQVIEFRKDKRSLKKYRQFLHWLDKEMIGKSLAYIEDDITIKLEDYQSSLKKHGIKTIIGTIEEMLDSKYLLGTSSVIGSISIAGYPALGVLAGAGLILGKMAVKLSKMCLDFDDTERGTNSEISWVYEVKRRLNK
ncbi:MAG: hypothetical protein JW787_03230 [Sedimentisphaerales bacterium]|nr:hypothetical protein [Sedimentisphaerales bacterium]